MANKTPIDLTDQLALRRYLENLVVETPVFRPAAVQGDLTKLYSVPVLTSAELKYYVENLVKEFDTRMWTTINEVKYNLAQISAVLNKDTIDLGTLIVTDYTTTVDMNTKIATDIAVVTTDLTQNYYTAVGTDGAIASADTALKATIDSEYTNTATLELNYYTAVNTDAAIASAVTTLSTYVGDNYSTTSVINSTYATQTAVGAIYEVAVEANGHVSGYRSVATGTNSIFQIYAEQFAISSSLTDEGYSPFQVDTANHKINMTSDVAIDGNLLVSKSITSNQIAANTITANEIAANTITTTELAVIGVATFTNDAGYTDDTAVNYILDGTTSLNPNIVSLGTKTITQYVADEIDNEVVVFSGTNHTTQTGMKLNDLYIESSTATGSSGVVVDVVNTYKYNGTAWVQINTNANLTALADLTDGKRTVYAGTSVPSSPEINDIWIPETGVVGYTAEELYKYNGTAWVIPVKYTDDTTATSAYNLADSKATLAEVQAQGYVLPAGVANAINTNTTKIEGAKIVTGSITALEIDVADVQAATVTASKINTLSIVAGSVAILTGGYIKSGQTAYNSGTGFWLGDVAGTTKLSIGTSTNGITWNGSTLAINGSLIVTDNIVNNAITVISRYSNSAEFILPSYNSWYTAGSITITVVAGQTVDVSVNFSANKGGCVEAISLRILRNTTTIYGSSSIGSNSLSLFAQPMYFANSWSPNQLFVIDSPGTGTFTYYFQVATQGQSSTTHQKVRQRYMRAEIFKK